MNLYIANLNVVVDFVLKIELIVLDDSEDALDIGAGSGDFGGRGSIGGDVFTS